MRKKHLSYKSLMMLFVMLATFSLYSCTNEDNSTSSASFKTIAVSHPKLGLLNNKGTQMSCVKVDLTSKTGVNSAFISTKNMEPAENTFLIWFCNQKDVTFDVKMGTGNEGDPLIYSNVSNGMVTDFLFSDQLYISNPSNATGDLYVVCSLVRVPNRGLKNSSDNISVEVAEGHQNKQKHRASDNFELGSYGKYKISCPDDATFDIMQDISSRHDETHYVGLTNGDEITCISGNLYIANSSMKMTVVFMPQITGEEWMTTIPDSKKLNELSIPGTHDSGTYLASPGGSKCQNFDAKGQLAHGIRFFDVRLDNQLEICHGIDHFNIHFDDMLEDFYDFLDKHPKEVVLMCVKDETGDNEVPDKFKQYVENNKLKNYLYTDNQIPTLKECRGKIVLFRRFAMPSGKSSYGIDLYSRWPDNTTDNFVNKDGVKLYIEDHYYKYFDDHGVAEKAKDVSDAITAAVSDSFKDYQFIIFNSMAVSGVIGSSGIPGTPYHWAWESNPNLSDKLCTKLKNYKDEQKRLGIILMDFYNKHGYDDYLYNVQRIVNTNFGDKYFNFE